MASADRDAYFLDEEEDNGLSEAEMDLEENML